jgi:predicted dehydrogenase
LATLLLAKPKDIEANCKMGTTNVDESCQMTFLYPSGQTAILSSSIIKNTGIKAEITFEKGTIRINPRWHEPSSIVIQKSGQKSEIIDYQNKGFGFSYEALAVMEDINNGYLENSFMTHSFSLSIIETLDEVRKICGIHYPEDY